MRTYPDIPPPELAERAYEVAVQECGAPSDDDTCARWVAYTQQESPSHKEFRVCHLLGGGGKLRYSYYNGFYINMYPEDETPEKIEMIDRAMERLADINEELVDEDNYIVPPQRSRTLTAHVTRRVKGRLPRYVDED